uniref:Uncharacterized protein n=1 Tax=Physcomitrium patens TaxID=3218 RepID=A0A2K1KVV4_PHYPA|nr:hypothetical protein PHYPA_004897 [Physcomitrium patens]
MDLYYYWSLDFIGPLFVTLYRTKYMLVMIELMALPQNSSKLIAMNFLIKYWHILEDMLKS